MTNQPEHTYKAHEYYPWIWTPPIPVIHDEKQYDSSGHDLLLKMQQEHFWYSGRHRFLLNATKKFGLNHFPEDSSPSVIDLGGGCGGWVQYLYNKNIWPNCELALSDSSVNALTMAREKLPPNIGYFQTDLLSLQWSERWDIAYMLDVLEHLPDPARALKEIHKALRPGGLLFLTVPALQFFWSFVDEFGHHQKRYHHSDFQALADVSGFEILDNRYFMFFLSPLLLMSRKASSRKNMDPETEKAMIQKLHHIPPTVLNRVLTMIFAAETPLGNHIHFPWGTSLLCVMRKSSH